MKYIYIKKSQNTFYNILKWYSFVFSPVFVFPFFIIYTFQTNFTHVMWRLFPNNGRYSLNFKWFFEKQLNWIFYYIQKKRIWKEVKNHTECNFHFFFEFHCLVVFPTTLNTNYGHIWCNEWNRCLGGFFGSVKT